MVLILTFKTARNKYDIFEKNTNKNADYCKWFNIQVILLTSIFYESNMYHLSDLAHYPSLPGIANGDKSWSLYGACTYFKVILV
jgi:hypothetical protein